MGNSSTGSRFGAVPSINGTVALQLGALGLTLFPCSENKAPLTSHGFKDASADAGRIREWWAKHPEALIGYVPGSLDLVGLDVDRGGLKARKDLVAELGEPAASYMSNKPGRGHMLWQVSDGGEIPQGAWTTEHGGGDIRYKDGYLIAWQAPRLLKHLQKGGGESVTASAVTALMGKTASYAEGGRNNRLFAEAVADMEAGGDGKRAEERARAEGLPEQEIRRTMASARKAAELSGNVGAPMSVEEAAALFANAGVGQTEPTAYRVALVSMASVKPKPKSWLIHNWLPRGHISLLAGAPGMGKTTIAVKLAALFSRGGYWPNDEGNLFIKPCDTLLYTGEDDTATTIVPNLLVNGADMNRVHMAKIEQAKPRPFDPSLDLKGLEAAIRAHPRPVGLVVIDPALALAKDAKDEYRASEIRKALEPVQLFAARLDCAVLCLTHFLKRARASAGSVLDRVIGSQAWGAVARMVLAADHVNGDTALLRVKSNLGPDGGGYLYSLEQSSVVPDGANLPPNVSGSRLAFGEALEGKADTLLASTEAADDRKAERHSAEDWLRQYFAQAPTEGVTWAEIVRDGKADGFTEHTLRRARNALKAASEVQSRRTGYGKEGRTLWGSYLPNSPV